LQRKFIAEGDGNIFDFFRKSKINHVNPVNPVEWSFLSAMSYKQINSKLKTQN